MNTDCAFILETGGANRFTASLKEKTALLSSVVLTLFSVLFGFQFSGHEITIGSYDNHVNQI